MLKRAMWSVAICAGMMLLRPGMALAQAAPSPSPGGGAPMDNPGASLTGLPFSGTLHDLSMWATGIGFAVCVLVWLSGTGVLRPVGHLFNHSQTAVRGTSAALAAIIGAIFLGCGWILIAFFWHVGQGVH